MPININQLNTSPLAAVASRNVSRLGLEAYPIDYGAVMKGVAQGIYKKADLDAVYAGQANQYKISQMYQQGELSRQEAQQQFQANQSQLQRAYESIQNDKNRAIQQQQVNQEGNFQQGQLGNQQAELGLHGQEITQQGAYQQGELSNQQQQLAQQGQFQNAQIALQNKQLQQNAPEVQARTALYNMQTLAAKGDTYNNAIGSYGAAARSIIMSGLPQDKKQAALNTLIESANKEGYLSTQMADQFKALPIEQQYAQAEQWIGLSAHASQLADSVAQNGMGFYMNAQGQFQALPLDKAQQARSQSVLQGIQGASDLLQQNIQTLKDASKSGQDFYAGSGRLQNTIGAVEGFLGVSGTDAEKLRAQRQALEQTNFKIATYLTQAQNNSSGPSTRNIQIAQNQMPSFNTATSNDEAIKAYQNTYDLLQKQQQNIGGNFTQGIKIGSPSTSSAPAAAPTQQSTVGLTLNGVPYSSQTHDQFISAIKAKYPAATDAQAEQYLQQQLQTGQQ